MTNRRMCVATRGLAEADLRQIAAEMPVGIDTVRQIFFLLQDTYATRNLCELHAVGALDNIIEAAMALAGRGPSRAD